MRFSLPFILSLLLALGSFVFFLPYIAKPVFGQGSSSNNKNSNTPPQWVIVGDKALQNIMPQDIEWKSIKPGTKITLKSGTYNAPFIITAQGERKNPIVLEPAEPGGVLFTKSVLFKGAKWVTVKGIEVKGSEYAGVAITDGSEGISLIGSTISQSAGGVWFNSKALGSHTIENNTIHENNTNGIGINGIINKKGHETVIRNNRVFRNGYHGIELSGTRFIIEGNSVWENGIGLSGTTGIHLYAGGFEGAPEMEGIGDYNIIRNNVVFRNSDTEGYDGNGIQLDRWCDNNVVTENTSFENDGAGISIFEANNNRVANNILYNNMQDSGRSHIYHGEILIVSHIGDDAEGSKGNIVENNTILYKDPISPIFFDDITKSENQKVENNFSSPIKNMPGKPSQGKTP